MMIFLWLFVGVTIRSSDAACVCESALPALLSLYHATNGAYWRDPWNITAGPNGNNVSVCDLKGITCAAPQSIFIQLTGQNLTGTIPDDLAPLHPYVYALDLSNNSLSGTLPASMSLYGATIGMITVMKNPRLTGTLPPELRNWTNLLDFTANACDFYGTLPPEYAEWGASIGYFAVFTNRISGTVPSEYQNWSSLVVFSISNNQMSGTIPEIVFTGWGRNLLDLSLANNSFYGNPFSTTLCAYAVALNNIRLEYNRFSGTIPSSCMSRFSALEQLYMSTNSFSGTIPSAIGSLSLLRAFDVSMNQFEGTLPAELSKLTALTSFSAQANNFSGTLPPQYASWLKISSFLVNSNKHLSGSLPEAYAAWGDSINVIRVSTNTFTGPLPDSWGRAFTSLTTLVFSGNRISGTIPASWSGMTKLTILGLDSNELVGTLPSSWKTLSSLQGLSINNNALLGGAIPPSWSGMSKLAFFVLCHTNVCGNATTFPYVAVLGGFTCPSSSLLATLKDTELINYVLTAPKVFSVECLNSTAGTPTPQSSGSNSGRGPKNSSASVLPYTTVATAAATTAVWSVVATRGLPISGASSPAASVAFLQGAFAASRLRRRCTAAEALNTESDPPLSDPMDNPTQIELPSSAGAYAGGAVVGNSALLMGVTLICHAAAALRTWDQLRPASSQRSRAVIKLLPSEGLRLPGGALAMYSLLLTPSIAACVVLWMSGGGGSGSDEEEETAAGSYVLGVIGAIIWVTPLGLITWRLLSVRFPFMTTKRRKRQPQRREEVVATNLSKPVAIAVVLPSTTNSDNNRENSSSKLKRSSLRWRRLFASVAELMMTPTHTWHIRDEFKGGGELTARSQKLFYHSYGAFFAGVRSEWRMLFALELFVALVCGAVQGAAEEIGTSGAASDACSAAEWGSATLAALTAAVLLLHVVVRPCLVRYDELQTIVLTALTVASEIANAVGGDAGEQVGEMIALTAAILQASLAVIEIFVERFVLDASPSVVASPYYAAAEEEEERSGAPQIDQSTLSSKRHARYGNPSDGHAPIITDPVVVASAADSLEQQQQQPTRNFVTLSQIKGLKHVLKLIAVQQHRQRHHRSPPSSEK